MKEVSLNELYTGSFYHVCTEGLELVTLLRDEEDYKVAWNYLALSAWRSDVEIVAFVLMSNHVHELIACSNVMPAQKSIRLFKRLLSAYLAKKYGLKKAMRGSGDSITRIDSIQYLRNCIASLMSGKKSI